MTPPATLAAPLDAIQPVSNAGTGVSLMDAFQSALRAAGETLYANPEAVSRTLFDGVEGFRLRESHMQDAVRSAGAGDGATPAAGAVRPAAPAAAPASDPAGDAAGGVPGPADQMKSAVTQTFGVMMETYSFALEASLVNNAATTFTSSVNTLIKTQ